MTRYIPEPFKIKMVEPIQLISREERKKTAVVMTGKTRLDQGPRCLNSGYISRSSIKGRNQIRASRLLLTSPKTRVIHRSSN